MWKRRPNHVEPYRGFTTADRLIMSGRVLHNKNHIFSENVNFFFSFLKILRRLYSREVAGVEVKIEVGDFKKSLFTDDEGYYFLNEAIDTPFKSDDNLEAKIKVGKKSFKARIIQYSNDISQLIVSDIDDTILLTEVKSPMRMVINSLMKSPFRRSSFRNAQAFFNHISHNGKDPFFYLSHSPWNFYSNIDQFLSIHHFPEGPILLRDFGMQLFNPPSSFSDHKKNNIELLISLFPEIPIVLIGDSGEKDPYIYSAIWAKYPDRIKHIYIRDVGDEKNKKKIQEMVEKLGITNFSLFADYGQLLNAAS